LAAGPEPSSLQLSLSNRGRQTIFGIEMSDSDRLFDELYLKTYAALQQDEEAKRLAQRTVRLAGFEPLADVLDAGCGYGRHSHFLAQAGYRVIGLDRSPVLLAEARRRWGKREWPRWVEADYRELPFAAASFDAVINLFTSFGLFGEVGDHKALSEFRRVLRSGGALILETMHRDHLMSIFQQRSWQELPDGAVLLEQRAFDPVGGIVEVVHTYWPAGEEPTAVTYRLRVYTASELGRMASTVGFTEVEFYGDSEGGPLSRDSRLILVARTSEG